MSVHVCDSNQAANCGLCSQSRCPACRQWPPTNPACQACAKNLLPETCVYMCLDEKHPAYPFRPTTVDPAKWYEFYLATKCQRDRSPTSPFCRQHTPTQWRQIGQREKNLLMYMSNGDPCNYFFVTSLLGEPEYRDLSTDQLMRLLFSPVGVLVIHPQYYAFVFLLWLSIDVARTASQKVAVQPSLASLQAAYTPHTYAGMAKYVGSLHGWLMADPNLEVLRWNMLVWKFMEAWNIMTEQCQAPPFSLNFEQVWRQEFERVQVPVNHSRWQNFVTNLRALGQVYNESFATYYQQVVEGVPPEPPTSCNVVSGTK